MAEPRNKTPQTNPDPRRRSSYFLACFGFSGDGKLPSKKSSSLKSKSSSSLSWPMFRLSSKKSRSKTVPVDNTGKAEAADCKTHKSKKKSHSKPDYKSRSPQPPVSKHKPSRQNSKANQAATEKPKETRQGTEPENIYLGNRKLLDSTRTGSSQPGSPNAKAKPKIQTAKLTHTVSLPVLEGNTRVRNLPVHARINLKELRPKNNVGFVEKLDPVIGLSIIMVTLMIMLIWGRLCAILCTSAWFYFVPLFRTTEDNRNINNSMNSDQYLDLNSEEYKKNVVLKGLLERNHRVG